MKYTRKSMMCKGRVMKLKLTFCLRCKSSFFNKQQRSIFYWIIKKQLTLKILTTNKGKLALTGQKSVTTDPFLFLLLTPNPYGWKEEQGLSQTCQDLPPSSRSDL